MFTLIATFTAAALASGDPGRTPETGLVEVSLGVGQETRLLTETGDSCEDDCDAWDYSVDAPIRLGLRPHELLGAWGEVSWHRDVVDAADYGARGYGLAGGIHLTAPSADIPMSANLRPALSATARYLYTNQSDDDSEHRRLLIEASGTLVAGTDRDNVIAWVGPVVTLVSLRDLYVAEEGTNLTLVPSRPAGALLGAELISDSLGPAWNSRSGRLLLGVEGRLIDAWGARAWLGIAY